MRRRRHDGDLIGGHGGRGGVAHVGRQLQRSYGETKGAVSGRMARQS
jgi:hypothetical protein